MLQRNQHRKNLNSLVLNANIYRVLTDMRNKINFLLFYQFILYGISFRMAKVLRRQRKSSKQEMLIYGVMTKSVASIRQPCRQ